MKVMVTGGAGFLGTNIVLRCVKKKWKVRVFTLQGSNVSYIKHPLVEVVYGDIADTDSVLAAVKGMDAVIHTAGDTSFWKRLFERQRKTNVDGVRTVMEACLKAGVKKVVHTSTVDTYGYNPDGLADETWTGYNYGGMGYNYADTKREGEAIALSYSGKKMGVVVINPGSMMGPYDHTLQFGRLFMDIRDGKIPAVLPGGAPWAHVDEVAGAHVAALEKGRPGEKYICGGVNESYRTLFDIIAASIGVTPPKFTMTPWMTVAYGYLMEFLSEFTKRKPDLNPGQARYMSVFPKYDSSKAVKELGFRCLPLRQIVCDARDWYRANGFL